MTLEPELAALANAARLLVREGELDGELALSYIVWPSEDVLAALRAAGGERQDRHADTGADV